MSHIEIEIPIDDLTKETYRFVFIDNMGHNPRIVLDFYGKYTRKTKRHGWNTEGGHYSRMRHHQGSMKVDEVPFGEEIKKMALDKFVSGISVEKDKN